MKIGILAALILSFATTLSQAWNPATDQEAYEVARDAYVYAYPLVLMDAFMRQGTNYTEPTGIVTQAPYNQFSHAKGVPSVGLQGRSPSQCQRDTLYSSANLDLGPDPSCCRYPRPIATSCCLC